jgi:hypothetical protein
MLPQSFSPSFLSISALSMALLTPACSCQAVGVVSGSTSMSGPRSTTNLPYSATFITTRVQTLADGTTITHVQREFRARDSKGRTCMEIFVQEGLPDQNPDEPINVMIFDPTTGQHISLNPRRKTAKVVPIQAPPQSVIINSTVPSSSTTPSAAAPPEVQSTPLVPPPGLEKLSPQTIDGLYVEGTRITRVIPAGSMGNDREITTVQDVWRSRELGIEVLRKTTDPRSGETTMEMKDLNRDEPAPELFQIPADYKVIQD